MQTRKEGEGAKAIRGSERVAPGTAVGVGVLWTPLQR